MTDIRLLYVTTPTKDEATKIARQLIERKLVACANITPQMESIYPWQGQIQTESECVLVLKTHATKVEEVTREIENLHSYDTPCVLEIKVESGSSGYLTWLEEQLN